MIFTLLLAVCAAQGPPPYSEGKTAKAGSKGDGSGHHWADHKEHAFGFESKAFQTYVESGADGRPTTIGISFAADFDEVFKPDEERPEVANRMSLDVGHPCQEAIPFTHIQANYQPMGHPGGYTKAAYDEAMREGKITELFPVASYWQRHVDFHFHLDTVEESSQVLCDTFPPCAAGPEMMAKWTSFPEAKFMPPGFYADMTTMVPGQGLHLVPNEGHTREFFAKEYAPIYMTFDGKINAWEIMSTIESLVDFKQLGEAKVYDWPAPDEVQKSGYYPTKVRFAAAGEHGQRDSNDYFRVEFTGLVFRAAPESGDTEEAMCPAVECGQGGNNQALCSCGVVGNKFGGRQVNSVQVDSSCDCRDICITEKDATGYRFRAAKRRDRQGMCHCLRNARNNGKKMKKSYTSGLFGDRD